VYIELTFYDGVSDTMQNILTGAGIGNNTDTSFSDLRLSTFIEQQTTESLYYSPAWFGLMTRLYGYSFIPLIATNTAGQVTGFLPLCFIQSPLTGRRLVALPFSDYCPLLATDDAIASDLIAQAIRLAQQQKVKYLELRTGIIGVLAKHPSLVEGNLYVRWLLSLSAEPQAVWSGLRKPIQRQIKKSQSLGVQVHRAQNREDVKQYYRLHLHTRSKKHGMPAQSLRFFFELWDAFAASGAMQLLLAEYEGTIIAGMVLLASGSTVRYAYGASDERYLDLAPNNLLMWEAIRWGCTQGYHTLDLGRTACDNEGLMEFKRRWGAIKEPLPYYYYPNMAGLAATSESSWKSRLLTACWKRLPSPIAGSLGGFLYKHLG
jgi:CelD/BcsL family acetyltransferase involved in cellulose biosynthesis